MWPPMGARSSKNKRSRTKESWSWRGQPGHHSPFPVDLVPYRGPEILYCFLDIMSSYKIMENRINFGPQAITTNVDDYINDIKDCYEEGFHICDFVKIPGLKTTVKAEDWGQEQPYQVILSKALCQEQQEEKWEIQIIKSILSTRMLCSLEEDEDTSLCSVINRKAKLGARLLCASPVGYVKEDTINKQYGVIGVDLFFNTPHHDNPTIFKYHYVKVPSKYHLISDASQTVQQYVCDADFMGQLKLFLNDGWKLVDVCMDRIALSEAYEMNTLYRHVDTIWIFEKEAARLDDPTALYDGVIIEYMHKIKSTPSGDIPCKDWRPIIAAMGVLGWELTTVIQTPYLGQHGFNTYMLKLLMVFQRPIISESYKPKLTRHPKSPLISQYGITQRNTVTHATPILRPRRNESQRPGYYHHGLQKFIYTEPSTSQIGNGRIPQNSSCTDEVDVPNGSIPNSYLDKNFNPAGRASQSQRIPLTRTHSTPANSQYYVT